MINVLFLADQESLDQYTGIQLPILAELQVNQRLAVRLA